MDNWNKNMAFNRGQDDKWNRVTSTAFLLLSTSNPPDAREPGPVIGPHARVRPCPGEPPRAGTEVLCLEVDIDGRVERGYTIARMVGFRPESTSRFSRSTKLAIGAVFFAGSVLACSVLFL
jgi:hypothetical protein